MKEATGELNLTLITVVSIGILFVFFYTSLWPMIQSNMSKETSCSDAVCAKSAETSGDNVGLVRCQYGEEELYCPYKG